MNEVYIIREKSNCTCNQGADNLSTIWPTLEAAQWELQYEWGAEPGSNDSQYAYIEGWAISKHTVEPARERP